MDLDIFKEYLVLVSHRRYTSAARELCISQPSLSRHISALEKSLSQELFYDSQPLSLTVAGEVVLKYAARIIREYENMEKELDKLGSSSEHILIQDLLLANTLYYGIREALEIIKESYPGTSSDFVSLNDGMDLAESINSGSADIVFDSFISQEPHYAPIYPDSIKYIWIPEFHGELCLAVPKSMNIAAKDLLSLKDCKNMTFSFKYKKTSENFLMCFHELCEKKGFRPKIAYAAAESDLQFYSESSDDHCFLLTRVDKTYPTLIAPLIKANYDILTFQEEKYYVNGYALMAKEERCAPLSLLASLLEERAKAASAQLR